ncbi:hypothetical protein E2C01_003489 [Portunus trituberculatus]|uniref:Uncharacterized protein n=1 Tax=Portunus trituberculatus TaxID=210409 RepID=A0A5B7CQ99_PORTR|nr:hypothetical protein [Portunus trituberculatus]
MPSADDQSKARCMVRLECLSQSTEWSGVVARRGDVVVMGVVEAVRSVRGDVGNVKAVKQGSLLYRLYEVIRARPSLLVSARNSPTLCSTFPWCGLAGWTRRAALQRVVVVVVVVCARLGGGAVLSACHLSAPLHFIPLSHLRAAAWRGARQAGCAAFPIM